MIWGVCDREASRDFHFWSLASSKVYQPNLALLQTFYPLYFTQQQKETSFVFYFMGYVKTDRSLDVWKILKEKDANNNHFTHLLNFCIGSTKKGHARVDK